MIERFTPEDAGYVMHADLVDRLRAQYPAVPAWRVEQIIAAENDAVTGGLLTIVPAEVEAGAAEMLAQERARRHGTMKNDGEVA